MHNLDNTIIFLDAKAMMFNLFEGNLLAAEQAMQILQLVNPDNNISAEQLSSYFEDQSRFSVFQLTDAILNNHQKFYTNLFTISNFIIL